MTEPGLSQRMRQAVPAAMKARDRAAVAALRSAPGHADRADRLRAEADALAAFFD